MDFKVLVELLRLTGEKIVRLLNGIYDMKDYDVDDLNEFGDIGGLNQQETSYMASNGIYHFINLRSVLIVEN